MSPVRFLSFAFLLALTIFFFSAAQSAQSELVYTVITLDKGTLPGGAGPLPVPPAAEPIVEAYKRDLDRNCAELTTATGRGDAGARFESPFATVVDVNSDGRGDLFMTSARAPCDGAPSYDSGTAGYGARWAISKPDGSYAISDTMLRGAEIQETLRNGYQLILHLHGLSCGKIGAAQCRNVVRFDRSGEMVSVAWPDGHAAAPGERKPVAQRAAAPAAATADGDEPSPFIGADHNGSLMEMAGNRIIYAQPKPSLRDVVKPGTVLVEGRWNGEAFEGTAYAFKKGCEPASYRVSGRTIQRNGQLDLVLRGAGPLRQGCEVVSYSETSPHARLVFEKIMGN